MDATSRIRFQREARAAFALNDVNVCAVYDVGECGGQPYLVMEYLEGETLREHLRGGPLPLKELVDLGIQIASRGFSIQVPAGLGRSDSPRTQSAGHSAGQSKAAGR